jgi:hypothetical protein
MLQDNKTALDLVGNPEFKVMLQVIYIIRICRDWFPGTCFCDVGCLGRLQLKNSSVVKIMRHLTDYLPCTSCKFRRRRSAGTIKSVGVAESSMLYEA